MTLLLRRGLRSNVDKYTNYHIQGEPFYTTDTKQLFVSDGTKINPIQSLDMALTFDGDVLTFDGDILYYF